MNSALLMTRLRLLQQVDILGAKKGQVSQEFLKKLKIKRNGKDIMEVVSRGYWDERDQGFFVGVL